MSWHRRVPLLRIPWAGGVAIGVLALLLRLPLAGLPLERDEGEYAYTAQRWARGELPYRDSFDQKPPAIFVAYGLIQHSIGGTPAAIHWGAQLYTLGTLALLFILGRQLAAAAAGCAAAAFAAYMTTAPGVWGNAANTELFMLLPLTAAMLAACRAVERDSLLWALATGALSAMALLFKQMAITNLVFYAALVVWRAPRRAHATAMLCLGLVVPIAPVCAYFAAHGTWDAFYDATIGYNLQYAARAPLAEYPAHFWPNAWLVCKSFWPMLALATLQVARAWSAPPARRATVLVLVWLAASLAGTVSGGYFHSHYFMQTVPALATLAGMAAGAPMFRQLSVARRPLAPAALVAGAIAAGVLSNAWYYGPGDTHDKMFRLYGYTPFADSPAVARFIRERSNPDDTVFILGSEAQILYYAERRSATRYFYIYPLAGPYPNVLERQHEALREIARHPPRFIVTVFLPTSFLGAPETPRELIDRVRDMLDDSYRLAGAVGYTQGAATEFVTGERAEEAWRHAPVWYGLPSWCVLAVWERVT